MVFNNMEFESVFQNNFIKNLGNQLTNSEEIAKSFLTNYKFPDYRGFDLNRNGFFKTNSETITRKKNSPEIELERRSSKCQIQEHESAKGKFASLARKIDVKRDILHHRDIVQHHEETSETNIVSLEKYSKAMPTKIAQSVVKQLKKISGSRPKKQGDLHSNDNEPQKTAEYIKDEINRDGVMSIYIQENDNGKDSPFIKKSDLEIERNLNNEENSKMKSTKRISYLKLLSPGHLMVLFKKKRNNNIMAQENTSTSTIPLNNDQMVKIAEIKNHVKSASMENFQLPISINSYLNEGVENSNSIVEKCSVKNSINEAENGARPVKKLFILKFMFSKKKPPEGTVAV